GEVAFHSAAQPRDVFEFREIHFEEEPRSRRKRQQVLRGGLRKFVDGVTNQLNRFRVQLLCAALPQHFGRFISKSVCVLLTELVAAAMAVQVPVRADVHHEIENIRSASEMARKFVAPRAASERETDQVITPGRGPRKQLRIARETACPLPDRAVSRTSRRCGLKAVTGRQPVLCRFPAADDPWPIPSSPRAKCS